MSEYQQRVDRIKELAENPDALSAHVENHIDGLSDALPNVSQGLASHISTGIQYLNSKIPRPNSQLPLAAKWEPSEAQQEKFNRHYDAVDKPVDALNQIKDGTLTSETMEALMTVHPDLLKDMQNKLKSQISPDTAEDIPHHIKKAMSIFLGMPLQPSDLPAVRLANQAAFQGPQQLPSQQKMGQKSTLGGLKQLNVAGRVATDTDALENSKV